MESKYPFRVTRFGYVGPAGKTPTLLATVTFDSAVELRARAIPPEGERTGWSLELTGFKAKDRAEAIASAYLQEHGTEFIALLLAAYEDERLVGEPFDRGPERTLGLMADMGGNVRLV